ncbi:MAG: GxxExxY protein [Caldilineaceae bacterium]
MLLMKDEVYKIVGAAMEVHSQLGSGFLEAVYLEALARECQARNIPFEPQKPLQIRYKGQLLAKSYIADLVCYDAIIVELKAMEHLTNREQGQVLNYLKASGLRVGLLINFGSIGKLEWQKLVR